MNDDRQAPGSAANSNSRLSRQTTWEEASGQREASVPMAYLPAGVEFGPEFPEPVQFDPAGRRLSYRGLMSLASYEYLRGLSSDLPYQMAIERLFVASSSTAARSHARAKWIAACAAVAAGLMVVWLAVGNPGRPEPLEKLIESFDEPAVIVDADPDDGPAEPAAEQPPPMPEDEVGNG